MGNTKTSPVTFVSRCGPFQYFHTKRAHRDDGLDDLDVRHNQQEKNDQGPYSLLNLIAGFSNAFAVQQA